VLGRSCPWPSLKIEYFAMGSTRMDSDLPLPLPESPWSYWGGGAPEAKPVGAGGGFERGERGTLAVLLVVSGATGGDHLGVDVLPGEHDGSNESTALPSCVAQPCGGLLYWIVT
jgi:hypothetical protein